MQSSEWGVFHLKTLSTFHVSFINVALRKFCVLATVLLCLAPKNYFVDAKISSGKAHLSGARTEATLAKFAVSASSFVSIDVNLTAYGMYENEQHLKFHVYSDEDWPKVRKSPLCAEKIKYAEKVLPVIFDYQGLQPDDRKGSSKKSSKVEMYKARIQTEVENPSPNRRNQKDRSRYYYFAIDDCSLELANHDAGVPDMVYAIRLLNAYRDKKGEPVFDHLPADEDGIGLLLVLSIAFSTFLAVILFYKFARTIGGEVHVAILVVMAACGFNAISALCELLHRMAFSKNGIGVYSLDALSSHFEALSDSMVALILLSIGGGWTLPSDVVGGGLTNKSANQFWQGVRNPAGSLLDLISSGGGSGDRKGGILALTIIAVHAGLAQWGRTFDDDFDTYHALEHPPGRALMTLRFVLGLVFVTGVGMVRSGGRCPPSLMSFLTKFGLVGLSYFASLPGVSMFVGSALPYHRRHQALHWGAALVQACSLASLTWLFVGNADASAYHRLSKAVKHSDGDMTGDLMSTVNGGANSTRPTMWRLGKTKIRLD
mmetsp:Transcript_32/g.48  ORF Transcript_32/g.48 Transcript_32/m.48 type:complete len:544 (+) Transcript_32:135-1766(+)